MTHNLNVNGNTAEEFREDSIGDMMPNLEDISVTKTEVKEEFYDFDIPMADSELLNVKEEYISSPENSFRKENLELANSTTQSLNENVDTGSCEFKVTDLEETKYRCELCHSNFDTEIYLMCHYEECSFAKKKISRKGIRKRYKCAHCMFSTSIRYNFVTHVGVHAKVKPFKCTYKNCKCTPGQDDSCKCKMCGFVTIEKAVLQKHVLMKHTAKSNKYKCSDCTYATHMKIYLMKHIRRHSNENLFKCSTCGYATTYKPYLNVHILARHSTERKKYKCKHCHYATHWKTSFISHSYIHTGDRPFKCTYKNCKCTHQDTSCKCDMCGFETISSGRLNKHVSTKHNAKSNKYKCKNCKFATHHRAYLKVHNRIHTGDKPFKCTYKNCNCTPGQDEPCKCDTCGYAAINNGLLKRHILMNHNTESKKYQCSYCNYATHVKTYLTKHSRTHANHTLFKCTYKDCKCTPAQGEFCSCDECGFATSTQRNLQNHALRMHSTKLKKYMCSDCKYATHVRKYLVEHVRIHGIRPRTVRTEKLFKCTYKNCKCTPEQKELCDCTMCEYAGANKHLLKQHILARHNAEPKKYRCKDCNYATHAKASLKLHSLIHADDRPFKCTYIKCKCTPGQAESCKCDPCGYATVNNSTLKLHVLIQHSTESKKYVCSYCKYATHLKAVLTRHIRIHTNERPYKCTYKNCKCTPGQKESCKCGTCTYAATNKSILDQHILVTHSTVPKKHKCKDCTYAAHTKTSLVVHIRTHTGDRPYKCTYKNCKCTPGQSQPCECDMCEFSATYKNSLDRHILVRHSVEPKKFKCKDCDYAAHLKSSLRAHSRIHTADKPFKCTYKNCKCTPGQNDPCECDTCGYSSKDRRTLRKHILKHGA